MYKKLESGFIKRDEVSHSGGTATVYKYESRSLSRTPIAVKEITFEKAGRFAQKIWENEVKFLRVLHGFGERNDIVKMQFAEEYDSRDEFSGRIIAFEWLEEDLERRLARAGLMTAGKAVDLMSKVASALTFAHRQNIYHRDLTPRNIMFRSPEDSQPVLIDFGLGKEEVQGYNNQTVAAWKTPTYAPDKILKPIDKDIYGFFAVYARLLMERPPVNKTDFGNLLTAVLQKPEIGNHQKKAMSKILLEEDFSDYDHLDPSKKLKAFWDAAIGTRSDSPSIKATFRAAVVPPSFGLRVQQIFADAEAEVATCNYQYDFLKSNAVVVLASHTSEAFLVTLGRIKGKPSRLIILDTYDPKKHGPVTKIGKLGHEFIIDIVSPDHGGASNSEEFAKLKNALRGVRPDSKPDSTMLEIWGKQLSLQELAIERFPKLSFKRVLDDGLNVVLKVEDNSTIPEVDEILDMTFVIEMGSGDIEVTAIEKRDNGIRFEKRGFGKIPSNGELKAVLGPDENSINRQKSALEKVRESFKEAGQLALSLVSPDQSRQIDEDTRSAFEPEMVNLDSDKQEAVTGALRSDDVFVVKGPPGTGKTHLIAEFIGQILKRQPSAKILLVSQTHIAVDNALERIEKESDRPPYIVRVGREENISPGIRKFTIDAHLKDWLRQTKLNSAQWLKSKLPEGIEPNIFSDKQVLEELQDGLSQLEELLEREHTELSKALSEAAKNDKRELNQQRKLIKQAGGSPAETLIRIEKDIEKIKKNNDSLLQKFSRVANFDFKSAVSDQIRTELQEINRKLQVLDERTKAAIKFQTDWTRRVEEDTSIRSVITDKASVVAGTCIGFLRENSVETLLFDYVIVDEASKATATEALVPALQGEKILFVGDNNQLPPMQKDFVGVGEIMKDLGLNQADLEKTLFDHLFNRLPSSKKVLLSKQYRMRQGISRLISECFYGGNLVAAETVQEDWDETLFPFSVSLIDTGTVNPNEISHKNSGYTNDIEAEQLVKELGDLFNNRLSRFDRGKGKVDPEVLVICAYAKQKELVLKKIRRSGLDTRVRVETVDASQGTEADIVYFLSTRSNARKGIGFLTDNRRVNVAMSRAKKAVFVFADIDRLPDMDSGLPKVVNFIMSNPNEYDIRRA